MRSNLRSASAQLLLDVLYRIGIAVAVDEAVAKLKPGAFDSEALSWEHGARRNDIHVAIINRQ